MFDRITLSEDLIDCRGEPVGRRGAVVSPESIAEVASHAPAHPRRALAGTFVDEDLELALDEPKYRHLFEGAGVKAVVRRAILASRLPDPLIEELYAMREATPELYRHGIVTAAVAVRMLLAAVGEARGVPELAAAALLHDLGMRHLPAPVLRSREPLTGTEAYGIAAHPLLGAYHLARLLGMHPAVAAARSHHWRCGQGYPALASPPSRSIEVVAVASTFAALTQPRPFRSDAFDARGAADVLVVDVTLGHADANTVKLLVHALRGGAGDVRSIRFGAERTGHAPEVNRHSPVVAPSRSSV